MKPFDPKEYKRDIVVMNLHKGKILLVFPTGARINDGTGILEGKYTDGRRVVIITDMNDPVPRRMYYRWYSATGWPVRRRNDMR